LRFGGVGTIAVHSCLWLKSDVVAKKTVIDLIHTVWPENASVRSGGYVSSSKVSWASFVLRGASILVTGAFSDWKSHEFHDHTWSRHSAVLDIGIENQDNACLFTHIAAVRRRE
jgi:hypothetical protein